ncbi:MAG TPA: PAS domain S-box protein, partial [Candidatus Saccharimonadia bacterium]|nr:PAS domain S-box protein [Candidatus Saccharimonadia bacterium]
LDPTGRVISWNAGAARLKGYKAHEIIGRHFSTFYTAEAKATGWPAVELERAAADGRFEDEGWRVRKDGTMFWANVIITALRGPGGELSGFAKVTRDLTERREHEVALRQSEERMRLVIEGVKDYAIFMLDPDGVILTWNTGAALIKGYTASEVIGTNFARFYPPDAAARKEPEIELATAKRIGRAETEGWRVRKDGLYFWANVIITALYGPDGTLRGYAKVTRDMTERKRVERLEEDAQRMNAFLAMLAHELRNPLAPIRNAANLLARMDADKSRTDWAAGVIERQVSHLSRLVDDLLDVSRITQGKIVIEKDVVELADVAARAAEATRPYIDARGHTLVLDVSPPHALVEGDLVRLVQVVSNLLHNAAKFTPDGGRIELSVTGGERAQIRVRDNGEGIASDLLPRVFDVFAQGESGIERARGGLGLGLTIARQIIELHGGTIRARSAGPGQGSEFSVVLPSIADSKARGSDGSKRTARESSGLRVLVVDDNVDSAVSLRLLLELSGYEAEVAHDGIEALERARTMVPDVVLLDIGLPKMNGYDVAREMRGDPTLAGVHLIAVTGYGQEEDRRLAREAGIEDHLVKPIDADLLFARLAALSRKR